MRTKTAIVALFMALIIAATITVIAKASPTELYYDRGNVNSQIQAPAGRGLGVHFTTSPAELFLSSARFYVGSANPPGQFGWEVLDWNSTSNLPGTNVLASGTGLTGLTYGWVSISIGIVVPTDFVVALYFQASQSVYLAQDTTPPITGRGYNYWPSYYPPPGWGAWADPTTGLPYGDLLIRATVEGAGSVVPEVPIGSIIASATMVIALAGYLAIPKLRNRPPPKI